MSAGLLKVALILIFAVPCFAADEQALKSLAEVKGLLKSVEQKSEDLQKLNTLLAEEERKADLAVSKPDVQAAQSVSHTKGCGPLTSFTQWKDCFIKTIRQYTSDAQEIADEL